MDATPEVQVQISLDTVVQKASALEDILRSCKARVSEGPGGGGEGWGSVETHDAPLGAETSADQLQLDECDSRSKTVSSPQPASHPPPTPPSSTTVDGHGEAVTQAWRQLTSYIVGLEKEVQHYRKLVEELQAREVYSQQLAGYLPQYLPGLPVPLSNGVAGLQTEGLGSVGGLPGGEVADGQQAAASGGPSPTEERAQGDQQWDQVTEDPECRCLLLVFSYLSTVSLCAVSRVSKKWYLMSRHPLLWRRVHITEVTLSSQALPAISQRCHHTDKIALHGLIPEMSICEEDLQSYIQRMKGSLEGGLTDVLSVCGRNLRSLSITECNLMITERVLWLVSAHCPNLEEFSYCSDEFPPTPESIWSMTNGCKHICRLSFPPFVGSPQAERFNDNCLQIIAHNWQQLTHLSMGGKAVSANGLAEIALFCPHLTHLEIIHGPHLNSKAITEICQEGVLQSLETISLSFTPISPKALLQLVVHCAQLGSLQLYLNLHTYFPNCDTEPTQINKYERILRNLKELQQHPRTVGIFHLHEQFL